MSEKIEEAMDRLRRSLSIWDDILSSKDEIEAWSSNSVSQLAVNTSNLDNSIRDEEFLKELEVHWLYRRGDLWYELVGPHGLQHVSQVHPCFQ